MITITRALARQARAIIGRALYGPGRSDATLPVRLVAGPERFYLRAQSSRAAVEYRSPDSQAPADLTVPLRLLADCEGRKAEPVRIESCEAGLVSAHWQDGPVPQVVTYDAPDSQPEFPEPPQEFGENPPELLSILAQAMETAEADCTRFALNTVQLRGRSGVVAATDGRQLLLHSGCMFPWDGDVLVPKTPLFGCKELPQDQPLLLGKLDDWLCVRVGPWTIWLASDKTGRFPQVENHLQPIGGATATLRISNDDAEFLLQSLPRLPGSSDGQAVTVDLNGRVAIRARPTVRGQATEIVLHGSTYSGEPIRISTDRRYLSRALALGFRELHLFGSRAPVQCQGPQRQYVWALLDPDSVVPATDNVVRIDSDQFPEKSPPTVRQRSPQRTAMSARNRNSSTHSAQPAEQEATVRPSPSTTDLIEQAEAVRLSLRESLVKTGELIHALKQQRKRSRLVASTLASLRELDAVAQ